MSDKEIKDILKLSADEIFDYIIKNPDQENEILNNLKIKERTKFFKVSADVKSYKLNDRGSAALKKDVLDNIIPNDKAILTLKVNNIKANPGQPRKFFNDAKLLELSESIKEHGLLQPIVVVDNNDCTYTLIAGERRLRAHKLANLEEIKAIVIDADEIRSRELALIENLHRDDLTPIEEGLSYLALQNVTGYSLRKLENAVKRDKNYVAARLNLTKFDDDCIDFIIKQELKNISKLTKILETEATVHKTLLEKLARNELSNEDIEKFKVDKIEKLPDEKLKNKTSSKPKDVDHDKFNEDGDFSKEKKEAQVEAISERVRNEEQNKDDDIDEVALPVIKETKAVKIMGDKLKIVNITIDIENMTGNDLEALKEFVSSL